MQPFLDHYLKDGPKPDTPRALVYETGADRWHRYDAWPRACAHREMTRRACFSGERKALAASCTTGQAAEHPQGSRRFAPTATPAHAALGAHPFAPPALGAHPFA